MRGAGRQDQTGTAGAAASSAQPSFLRHAACLACLPVRMILDKTVDGADEGSEQLSLTKTVQFAVFTKIAEIIFPAECRCRHAHADLETCFVVLSFGLKVGIDFQR